MLLFREVFLAETEATIGATSQCFFAAFVATPRHVKCMQSIGYGLFFHKMHIFPGLGVIDKS